MKFYNSLSKEIEFFETNSKEEPVLMYICGLTPYDSAHIGHARTYVSFDMIKRYLLKKGYSVFHIQNITDVDDKIIKRCKENGSDPKILAEQNHGEALQLFDKLNILRADVYPKVTEHIDEIIHAIQLLIKNGFAYETKTGVYYSVGRFQQYGALSGQNLGEIRAGSRKEVDETKEKPEDFALWKKTKGEIIEFDSSWGRGRPGWHIECSAMSMKYAKRTLDIHGGARDLIFPHHENEIAQSESAYGIKFCRYWLHTGFLTVSGEKMSKSLGNFITLKQALSSFEPNSLRMFFAQSHYRSPIDYDEDAIASAGESAERIFNCIGLAREALNKKDKVDQKFVLESNNVISLFYQSLENDFDTPNALAHLFELVKLTNAHVASGSLDQKQLAKILTEFDTMLWIIGLNEKQSDLSSKEGELRELAKELSSNYGISVDVSGDADSLLNSISEVRERLRQSKNYIASDKIRSRLTALGISIEDTRSGARKRVK